MASTFVVSAPGKVIVFGEHAAVYGYPAIAAAISLRSYLLVTTLSESQPTVRLNFRDIGLDHTWNINDLPWDCSHQCSKTIHPDSRITSIDPKLLNSISPHAEAVSKNLPELQRKTHVRSATAFLYLFLSLGSSANPGVVYTLRSTIPVGAGLGSSGSVCVCLAAALLLQMQVITRPHIDQPIEQANSQIDCINRWAFVGELCIHGDPSGIDNTVSTGGKAVMFRKNTSEPPTVTPITKFPKLSLLLIDTQEPRSTAMQVENVRALKDRQPQLIEPILGLIGELTTSALEHISSADFGGSGHCDDLLRLGDLVRMNHGLLVSLGVSHPRLDRVQKLVDDVAIGWTKLTGAGGGGCAFTLLHPSFNHGAVEELEKSLTDEGFRMYQTVLGTDGVGILGAPVVGHGLDGISADVDLESFENAAGVEGIESLVGVGPSGSRRGWTFW